MNLFRSERLRAFAAVALLSLPGLAFAADAAKPSPQVIEIRDRWAEVNYTMPKAQRSAAFEALAKRSEALRKEHPKDTGALIWDGIVLSSWAGERGGLGALGLVKQARKNFEDSLAIDPAALDGAAYTSLGALYYQVPGWPVGFGDDKKARELLRKGLAVNPNGIDANYFQADFLRDQEDWKGAVAALQKALAAPARPGRELADSGRRKEAEALLAQLRPHLASH
jgi:tetratricopeptide (TPR) repeat protein